MYNNFISINFLISYYFNFENFSNLHMNFLRLINYNVIDAVI